MALLHPRPTPTTSPRIPLKPSPVRLILLILGLKPLEVLLAITAFIGFAFGRTGLESEVGFEEGGGGGQGAGEMGSVPDVTMALASANDVRAQHRQLTT